MILLNGEPVPITIFPDKTSQVWKLPISMLHDATVAEITWQFENEAELIQIAQLKDLLNHYECYSNLYIKYLPYGRQDKEVGNDRTFALRTFAKILNSLNFNSVAISDPHSEVAIKLINKSYAVFPIAGLQLALTSCDANILCYPDKGALSKYANMYTHPYVYGEKVRDQLTGNILHYELIGNPKDKNVLIVDDICDGGLTFKLLTKDLLAKGASRVSLFVTHGLFTKGIETLLESGISSIYTKEGKIV